MGRILLIILVLGTFFVSACGNVQKNGDAPVHTEQGKIVINEANTQTLAKLQELKELSEANYRIADANTQMVEWRGREVALLKKYRLQVEQEAEEQIALQKQQLEEEYQLKLFNLRMRLESLKMRSKERTLLEDQIEDLRLEREARLALLQKKKQAYIDEKMKAYKIGMQQRLDAKASSLP